MSNIQTNFRAEDMLGAKKSVAKTVAPKKVAKPAPVVLEPVVSEPAIEVVLEDTLETELEAK